MGMSFRTGDDFRFLIVSVGLQALELRSKIRREGFGDSSFSINPSVFFINSIFKPRGFAASLILDEKNRSSITAIILFSGFALLILAYSPSKKGILKCCLFKWNDLFRL